MASDVRYTAIPATLWAGDSPFVTQLSARAQWLYLLLWTSEERDSAGFIPLQPTLWARCSKTTSKETVQSSIEELSAEGWLLVDEHMEQAWLCRFIEEDTWNNPNFYVSTLKVIRTCRSGPLRQAAWKEVRRLGLPPVKSEKPEVVEKMTGRMQAAYGALERHMRPGVDTPSKGGPWGLDTPRKGSNVNAHGGGGTGVGGNPASAESAKCSNCATHQAMERGLCAACLGRELAR
jgi:hypothetical protein